VYKRPHRYVAGAGCGKTLDRFEKKRQHISFNKNNLKVSYVMNLKRKSRRPEKLFFRGEKNGLAPEMLDALL
jgi:hypothetical protein